MGGSMPRLYHFLTGRHVHDELLNLHLGQPVAVPALPAGEHVMSLRLQAAEAGLVTAFPTSEDLSRHGREILLYETYVSPGEPFDSGRVLARLNLRIRQPLEPGREAQEIIDAGEASIRARLHR
jgi:hypothetical protein